MEFGLFFNISIFLLCFLLICFFWLRKKDKDQSICIVVLGDIGRSPRMEYHGISFLKEGFAVDMIGYAGSEPLIELRMHENVRIKYLKAVPKWNDHLPKLIGYIFKTIWQSLTLWYALLKDVQSSHLIMQNPPAIPAMPICWLFCWITSTKFVIDWHNYAYTIMALSIGREHSLVKITKFIEGYIGAKAHENFCVTKAMKEDLYNKWNIKANVLYDRPPTEFKPIDLKEKHNLLLKLSNKYEIFKGEDANTSVFTELVSHADIQLKKKRPGLIVSSTSWTEDEDFSLLFQALADYEIACCENSNLPDIICAITGKGPMKNFWNCIIKLKKWQHVKIITPWLENEDYPKLLASADLGVCLHASSSGLDLPMKVVDMFGCGLPVCAYNFQCLPELVKHDENSLIFSNSKELLQQLISWFTKFPNNIEQLEKDSKFRNELRTFQQIRWHGNWTTVVLPCFNTNAQ